MASAYLDSSALVKYYHTEVGSAAVLQFVEDPSVRYFISSLTTTEVHSAFALKLRTDEIDNLAFDRPWKQFEDELLCGEPGNIIPYTTEAGIQVAWGDPGRL